MRQVFVFGDPTSKRTEFLGQALAKYGVALQVVDESFGDLPHYEGIALKIDPLTYEESRLSELSKAVGGYVQQIQQFEELENLAILNSPKALLAVLDKQNCKDQLIKSGVRTTPLFALPEYGLESLLEEMTTQKRYNVFIKPNQGSGAMGVGAFRFEPRRNRMALYTSLAEIEGELVNTKRVRLYSEREQVEKILTALLKDSPIIEKWIPKATYEKKAYDLRVVVQFGKVEFMVGRLSTHPITNLHLSDGAISFEELRLPGEVQEQIKELAISAVNQFEGLQVAGVDVLLSAGRLTPYVIEINGQGDLIYQDIFAENRIYERQARWLVHGE